MKKFETELEADWIDLVEPDHEMQPPQTEQATGSVTRY